MPSADSLLPRFLDELLRTDTNVPAGQTEIAPGDPKIVEAVDRVVDPALISLRPDGLWRSDEGDLLARFGPPVKGGLLLQTYVVAQHANLSDAGARGLIADGSSHGIAGPAGVGSRSHPDQRSDGRSVRGCSRD